MANMIDMANNRANIAYVGHVPWHGLGQQLSPGADIDPWRNEAGLGWHAVQTPVTYEVDGAAQSFEDKFVLYRSDTKAPLSVVGDQYKIVQPSDILDMFKTLSEIGGFELETAGSLAGGRRIWGLAKVNDGAQIINRDRVRPYILLATSFDGTLATIAKFTAIRVVCHNTLSIAAPNKGEAARTGEAGDSEEGSARNVVRVMHNSRFDAELVRKQLGIVKDAWERFEVEANLLADQPMDFAKADGFLCELLQPLMPKGENAERDPRKTRGYSSLMALFMGGQIGAELSGQNKWGMLNAVTEYVDHHSGRSPDSRMKSAWFGRGERLKSAAKELLLAA